MPTYRTYIATVNTPGYLPTGEPAYFDTAAAAWTYLAEERDREEFDAYGPAEGDESGGADDTSGDAHRVARQTEPASIWLPTPGYTGDHDLGLVYSVEVYEGVICADCGARFADPDAGSLHWIAEHLEANTQ